MVAVEALLVGAIVLVISCSVSLYLYFRMSYAEKKMSMMESILVDMKMTLDSMVMDEGHGAPGGHIPIQGGMPAAPFLSVPSSVDEPAPAPAPASAETLDESIPEEGFYSSVLAAAHEESAEAGPGVSAEEALNGIEEAEKEEGAKGDAVMAPAVASASGSKLGPNYDSMTKQELVTLAEQRGLRAKKTMNRSELMTLLRRSEPAQNLAASTGGDSNVPGDSGIGGLFPGAAPLDGSVPVDLGANLESA